MVYDGLCLLHINFSPHFFMAQLKGYSNTQQIQQGILKLSAVLVLRELSDGGAPSAAPSALGAPGMSTIPSHGSYELGELGFPT